MCWWLVPNAAFAQRYIPDCAGHPEISQAHVARVNRNGDLILRDGRTVALEGIRLPEGPRLTQALSLLRALTQKPVTFAVTPPVVDRYARIRAQGFGEVWLQISLLEKGLALVALSPDRDECFPELYEAEMWARSGRTGLWADSTYQPRSPQAGKLMAGFQLIEGQVANVGLRDGRTIVSFDGGRGVSAVIAAEDRRAFRDFDLEGLETRRIRVRGVVQGARNGPEIALSNPAQIELLD
ncbi:MAG TPA: hypothetical protein VHM27_13180 [Rhizomicrobium sp.]|nr:hypothetical protein [Rhizomicrobium sp.]